MTVDTPKAGRPPLPLGGDPGGARRRRMMRSADLDPRLGHLFDMDKKIGKGAYGIVWKATDRKTKALVAVKKIYDAFQNATDAQRTFREIMFLNEFKCHPNVVRLLGVHKAANDKDIYLVFEYMEMDLHTVIKQGNILNESHKKYIIYQLLRALKYIHSGNVIHRDLKPSNVLLNSKCDCKLADFGLARSLTIEGSCLATRGAGRGYSSDDPALTNYVATRWYRAPEILAASKRYTKGVDMWSLGCIIGEMFVGKPLFPGTSSNHQLDLVLSMIPLPSSKDLEDVCGLEYEKFQNRGRKSSNSSGSSDPASDEPQVDALLMSCGAPRDAAKLAASLLVFNPFKRLTAATALDHTYVSRFHNERNEPSLKCPVVPMLRDDVRLTVDDYRQTIYSAIDNNSADRLRASVTRMGSQSQPMGSERMQNKNGERKSLEVLEYLASKAKADMGPGLFRRILQKELPEHNLGVSLVVAATSVAAAPAVARDDLPKTVTRIKNQEPKRCNSASGQKIEGDTKAGTLVTAFPTKAGKEVKEQYCKCRQHPSQQWCFVIQPPCLSTLGNRRNGTTALLHDCDNVRRQVQNSHKCPSNHCCPPPPNQDHHARSATKKSAKSPVRKVYTSATRPGAPVISSSSSSSGHGSRGGTRTSAGAIRKKESTAVVKPSTLENRCTCLCSTTPRHAPRSFKSKGGSVVVVSLAKKKASSGVNPALRRPSASSSGNTALTTTKHPATMTVVAAEVPKCVRRCRHN